MARTKASVGAKLTSGKSSKAVKTSSSAPNRSSSATPSTSKGSSGSGNPYHPRPTPKWQKPITRFFGEKTNEPQSDDDDEIACGSKDRRPRYNRLNSDTESDIEGAGDDLDASTASNMDLPPLSPNENSHKIVEYFEKSTKKTSETPQSSKGKGKGKGKGKKSIENGESDVNGNSDSNGNISENKNVSEDKENSSNNNLVDSTVVSKSVKRTSDSVEVSSPKRVKVDS